MKRRQYSDEFRASSVVMLEAAGYPESKGALARTAKRLGIHDRTLSRWYWKENNPAPAELVNEKRLELSELLDGEIRDALLAMGSAREEASYRDLGVVVGILVDKKQLISGAATQRTEILGDIPVTYVDYRDGFGASGDEAGPRDDS